MIKLLSLLAFPLFTSCSPFQNRTLEVGGARYTFPSDHIFSLWNEKANRFARLHPPGRRFDLIYSPRQFGRSPQGPDIPVIPTINTSSGIPVTITKVDGVTVVCGDKLSFFWCGFRVIDAGSIPWSVVFDRNHMSSAKQFEAESIALLAGYRKRHADRKSG
jgi:hypothetical protein